MKTKKRSISNFVYHNKDFFHILYENDFFPNIKLNKKASNKSDSRLCMLYSKYEHLTNVERFGLWFYHYKSIGSNTPKIYTPSYLNIDSDNFDEIFYENKKVIKNYTTPAWYNFLYNNIAREIYWEMWNNFNLDYYPWTHATYWMDFRINYLRWEKFLYKRLRNDNWWFEMTKHHEFWEPANKRSAFHTHIKQAYGVEGFLRTKRLRLRFMKKSIF